MLTAYQNSAAEKPISPESAIIRRLRAALRKKGGAALDDFWRSVEREKTPVIEEIADDPENVGCTFVFKGDETTTSVAVSLPPFSRLFPENFQMARIAETNVWFASLKLPKESLFVYSLVVNCPFQTVNPGSPKAEIDAHRRASRADFFNPNYLNETRSFVETPNAGRRTYFENRAGARSGKIERFSLKSEILNNERAVSIYTPPGFEASKTYSLLVLFDEEIYLNEIKAPLILDNLLAEKLIPPMIAAFVGNVENGRETELAGNPRFADFINYELLGRVGKAYKIAENPEHRIIGGASFGGLAAVFTGLSAPAAFGRILSQSGSFWRGFDAVVAKILERNLPSQKIYLDAGIYEIEKRGGISLLDANRDLRDVLRENGYAVGYAEFKGGHGAVNWRANLADGLIFLTKDLAEKQNPVGNPNLF